MNFDEYQKFTATTAEYPDKENNLTYPTLGLTGESGEVAEKVKKIIRDNGGVVSGEKRQELIKELGDVLWYISQLASVLGYSLNTVALLNVDKLMSRKERGVMKGSGDNR